MHAAEPADPETLANFVDLDGGRGVIIVVAHPDDETIGLGGHLWQMPNAIIVHVTDGAPRDLADAQACGFDSWEDYGHARRAELEAAVAEAGFGKDALISFEVPDQRVAHSMAAVASTLTRLFAERHARIVFTHPYEGGHPDHDATAFAVHAACRTLENAGELAPQCVEMAFYHAGRDGLVLQDFSPEPSCRTIEIELATGALATKRRMLAHHATQRRTLAPFSDARERFRFAPSYDFSKLPNRGRLYYEDLPVHFRGPDWPPLVERALENLGLAGT